METPNFKLRNGEKTDTGWIYDTWVRSFRGSAFAKQISAGVYYPNHKALIGDLLAKSNLLIACNPEDHNHNYGWACYSKIWKMPVLHYSYVKDPFRRLGICRMLLDVVRGNHKDLYATHRSSKFRFIQEPLNLIYNPYILKEFLLTMKGKDDGL